MALVSIPEKFKQAIIDHAKRVAPQECCGILAGLDNVVDRVYLCRNVSPTPETSYMVPTAQRDTAFEDIARNGLDLLAFYHSHPKRATELSTSDKAHAYYKSVNIVIVSLATDPPEIAVHDLEELEC